VSVEFDPVKLDPRRRRVDPIVVGVVLVVIALAVAVIKPWQPSATVGAPSPSVAAVAPSPTASSSVVPTATTRPAPRVTPRPPIWADLAPFVTSHDAWGVRAVLLDTAGPAGSLGGPRYLDEWAPMTIDGVGDAGAYITPTEDSIVALGATAPLADLPEDIRIWRVHANAQLEWMNARLIAGAANGSFLFVRPGVGDASFEPWDSGQYRIDVLAAGGIQRIAVSIPGRFGIVSSPDVWSPLEPDLVPASASDPSNVQAGMFATVDGIGVPLTAERDRLLSDDEAWLDLVRTGGQFVTTAYLPRATGLGVMLPSHASFERASIHRLAPDPLAVDPPGSGGISTLRNQTPYVWFGAPDGGAWAPGVYAISVVWTDGSGRHDETWHAELRPGLG
jgi:hypothetical protein